MTKQDIINTLHEFRTTHAGWGSQERVIVDGINLDQIIEPDNYLESELYKWLNVNKNNLLAFSWYRDLKETHAKLHHNYSSLFYVSIRKYNPKTRDQLTKDFRLLETDLLEFENKMVDIEKQLIDMSVLDFLDKTLKSNAEYRKISDEDKQTSISEDSNPSIIKQDQAENVTESSDYKDTPIEYSHNGDDKDLDESGEQVTSTESRMIKSTFIEDTTIETNEDKTLDVITETESENISNSISDESIDTLGINIDAELETETGAELQRIDINKFAEEEILVSNIVEKDLIDNDLINDAAEVEESNTSSEIVIKAKDNESKETNPVDNQFVEMVKKISIERPSHINSVKTSLIKNRSLKQQNILQLKQEKDFTELEFKHLEEKEKLTQKSIDQLEEHLVFKKEQIEEEHSDNKKLLQKESDAKNKVEEYLHSTEDSKALILNEIADLEKLNTEDEIQSKDDQQTTTIEKQFGVLKLNKNNDLTSLEDRLLLKKNNLIELQSELLSLEDDILEMEAEVNNKKNDIADLEEKERVKNEERLNISKNLQEQINQRNEIIEDKLEALNKMSDDIESTKNEVRNFNIHLEELNKAIELAADNTELTNLEQQKIKKLKNLSETEDLKTKKQDEINDLQAKLELEEGILKELDSDISGKNIIGEEKVLETAE